jgi:hypothetical protein
MMQTGSSARDANEADVQDPFRYMGILRHWLTFMAAGLQKL